MCGRRCNSVIEGTDKEKNFVLLDLFIIAAKVISNVSK
jgi:hypothetical protein